jgi:hypothetical protein
MDPYATLKRYSEAFADNDTYEMHNALGDLYNWVAKNGFVDTVLVRRLIELLSLRSADCHNLLDRLSRFH